MAGGDGCGCFHRLLIEGARGLPLFAETSGADRPEMTHRRRLLRHQPPQGFQPGLDIAAVPRAHAGNDQGLRQPRIVIGKTFFEPYPFRRLHRPKAEHQPVGQNTAHVAGAAIIWNHCAIAIQTQQRESRSTGRTKRFRYRQRPGEQGGRPLTPGAVGISARTLTQRPQGPSMAVLGALLFEPGAVVAHEIAKPAGSRIPRMLDEGSKTRRQQIRQRLLAGLVERAGQ